jgi:hypothetical protein
VLETLVFPPRFSIAQIATLFAISSISSRKPIRRSLLSSKPSHVKAAMVLVVVEDTEVVAVADEAEPLETGITERPLVVVMVVVVVVVEEEDTAVVAEDMVTAAVAAPATAVADTVAAEEEDTAVVVTEDPNPLPNTAVVEEVEEAVLLPPAGGRLGPPLGSILGEPPTNGGNLA